MIHRAPRNPSARYVLVPTTTIKDGRLSFAALSLLIRILAHPDQWEVWIGAVIRAERDAPRPRRAGLDAIRSHLKELEAAGYLVRNCCRKPDSSFYCRSEADDTPQNSDLAGSGSVSTVNQAAASSLSPPRHDLARNGIRGT